MFALDYIVTFIYGLLWSSAVRWFNFWQRARLVARAANWPHPSGRVLTAEAKSTDDRRPVWAGQISYYYAVNGEYCSGIAKLPAEDESHAKGLVLGWGDREIIVRYFPADPGVSALLLDDQKESVGLVG
jgi:hypothetical protein